MEVTNTGNNVWLFDDCDLAEVAEKRWIEEGLEVDRLGNLVFVFTQKDQMRISKWKHFNIDDIVIYEETKYQVEKDYGKGIYLIGNEHSFVDLIHSNALKLADSNKDNLEALI